MTEELTYSSLTVITMLMNTKSWIFDLTERADFVDTEPITVSNRSKITFWRSTKQATIYIVQMT